MRAALALPALAVVAALAIALLALSAGAAPAGTCASIRGGGSGGNSQIRFLDAREDHATFTFGQSADGLAQRIRGGAMQNPVTWFEIIGKDAAALQRFYKDVFGWKLTPPVAEMGNYSMLAEHGPDAKGAGGGIGGAMNDESRVSVYIEVDDPQRYLERATKAGGTMLMPVTQITPDTMIAMFRDPAGNTTGILKANPRRPEPAAAARGAGGRSRAGTATRRSGTSTRRAGAAQRGRAGRTTASKTRRTTRRAKRR